MNFNFLLKLTIILTLEPRCWVGDCLWNRLGKDRVESFNSPFNCTTNAHSGILSVLTRKSVAPNDLMVPLTTSDPEASTRSKSVTVTESPPVTETNKVEFRPEQSEKHFIFYIDDELLFPKTILLYYNDIYSSTTVFNNDNNKKFIFTSNHQLECFLKDHVTLKTVYNGC